MIATIETSTLEKERPYLASKFHKLHFLLSYEELLLLFKDLEFSIHPLGGLLDEGDLTLAFSSFALAYNKNLENFYCKGVKEKMPSYLLTNDQSALYKVEVGENKYLLKVRKPVVFIKPHFFTISDKKAHSTLGKEAIYWGFCLSYPQIFQDKVFEKVDNRFSNTALFIHLRKKLRSLSKSITFQIDEDKIVTSYRLGKELCMQKNPDLEKKQIKIFGA